MLKILIDEGLTSQGQISGIGHHMVNLANHLKDITPCDITHYNVLRKIPRYFRKWAYIGTCNISSLYKSYDLIHHLANYIPLVRGNNKHILTIYDLSVLHYQETISLAWRHYNKIALRNAIKRADGIIAISSSIRDELLQTFPDLNGDNVFICPTGLRKMLFICKPKEESLSALCLKSFSYFLFVGDLTKRKNLGFLLSTFIDAKKRQLIHETTKLILVGKRAWGYTEFKSLLRPDMGIQELGYLTDEQLVTLYRYSKAFVFPSIYEGFGMPVIEAMSQNIPIIISNIPTNIELNNAHNNQMFCFDLGDQEGLIRCFQKIENNYQTIRASLNYGDLSKYTYENIAARHLDIYLKLLNE